jgi:hypothetical protein
MTQTTTASATFSNRHAAQRAAQRLVEGGFARDSVSMKRLYSDSEDYEVSVRARDGNVERAEDLLHARPEVHDFAGNRVDVRPLMLLMGALAVGVAGYTFYALSPRWSGEQQHDERPRSRSRRRDR